MASSASEFTTFMEEPPTIEINSGVVLLRYRIGTCCSNRAMSVRCLQKGVDRALKALRMHAAGDDHVMVDE